MKIPARFSALWQGAILALSLTTADAGHAAPPEPALKGEGTKLWHRATAALKAGHMSEAVSGWRKVWDHKPGIPEVACNIGQGEIRLDHLREAYPWLTRCTRLLASSTDEDDIVLRNNATVALLFVREQLSTLTIEVHEPGARVVIDDGEIHITPIPDDVLVLPGEHRIQAYKDVRTTWTSLTTKPGKEYRVALYLPPTVPLSVTPPSLPPAWYGYPDLHEPFRLWPVVVGGSLGLSALAVGTGFLFASNSAGTDASRVITGIQNDGLSCTKPPIASNCEWYNELESKRATYSTASIGLFIASGVLLGGVIGYTIYETRRVLRDSFGDGITDPKDIKPISRLTVATTGTGLVARYQW